MKACVLERPAPVESRPLRVTDVPAPAPSDDKLLVSVSACGICRTDLHVIEGELPPRVSHVIPGHQVVGRVVAMGAQVEGLKPGDRIGVAWLNRTCGDCPYSSSGRENLCEHPQFTGWTANGGGSPNTPSRPPGSHIGYRKGLTTCRWRRSFGPAVGPFEAIVSLLPQAE